MIRYTGILTLLLLIVAGVPWYWRFLPSSGNDLVHGVPQWFVISVAVSLFVSILTSAQYLVPWPDEIDERAALPDDADEQLDTKGRS